MIKALTLRNLPPDIATAIENEARRNGASLNATVIRLLRQSIFPDKSPGGGETRRFHDLDDLAGTWSKEEADEFDRYLEETRRLDMELTKLDWQKEHTEK